MGPDWKLDRRGSGRLFWRRDSASSLDATTPPKDGTTPPKERVKFRYDVEVLEFWEAEDADNETQRREALRASKTPKPAPPMILCVACVVAIAMMICYQWILSA